AAASDALALIAEGRCGDPFAVLGAHPLAQGWALRAFLPGAEAAELVDPQGEVLAEAAHLGRGLFEARLPARPDAWQWRARRGEDVWQEDDPYRFGPLLGDLDEHLISEGSHGELWRVLGAHPRRHDGAEGVHFAVWAPGAARVSVVGPFNGWDGRRHPMRARGASGVWEIFLPGLAAGIDYKYEILGQDGALQPPKADPVGFAAALRPDNVSRVARLDGHDWQDADWMAERAARNRVDAPISIYEAHLPSWRRMDGWRWPDWDELAQTLVPYVADMGFTHIEALPVSEHPLDASWGYQPVGLYAPTSRHGDLAGFRRFVEACHAARLGLILDWVPAHFPTDPHGLAQFDGSHLYEHADPRQGFHPDWNTAIYNYGRNEVANYLIANARYWVREHHVDGLRVDAVASMLYLDYSRKDGEWAPNRFGGRENLEAIEFLRRMNREVYGDDPSVMTIAEESTAWPGVSRPAHDGGLGFGFKWNMGWMHDSLQYMAREPVHRRWHHGEMSFGLHYAFSENFVLPLSHDEVVHGKGSILGRMPGERWDAFADLRAYYAFMWAHPGKKLLFMGQEFGQQAEWNHEAELDWSALSDPLHKGVQDLVRRLNRLYRDAPALHRLDAEEDGFRWIDGGAEDASVYAWIRLSPGEAPVVALFNFSGALQSGWRFGVPGGEAPWRVEIDTDAAALGGAGRGPVGPLASTAEPSHGFDRSLTLDLPPRSAVILRQERV
ncbi:MAG: 1,4-alpha-glucan branching protein GlgB, partial [Pseudomonadota bacterium]